MAEPAPAPPRPTVAVIGGGPAGLMAAETLAEGGAAVTVIDRMPSLGRKLLMAGRGGLNLTHTEPVDAMLGRYGAATRMLSPAITALPPASVLAWCHGLGQPTFVGSSGRVFPKTMKAAPLLRAWLRRLDRLGVGQRLRWRWTGWTDGALHFDTPEGAQTLTPDATVLACGGASWPRLGADGTWTAALGGMVAPLRPANCGFEIGWSDVIRSRFAGTPLKRIALQFGGAAVRGEAMVTAEGIEGGAVYALAARLRDALSAGDTVILHIDLQPDMTHAALAARLNGPRGSESLSNHLRKAGNLPPVGVGLVQEALHGGAANGDLAALVKAVPLRLEAARPIARAISTAGGLRFDALDARLMLHRRPGVFAAGEMLDWEAPTGGYLLQACFSTGAAAGTGALAWLREAGLWPN